MPATLRVRSIPGGVEVRSPSRRLFELAGIFAVIAGVLYAIGGVMAFFAVLPSAVALAALALAVVVSTRPTRLAFVEDRFVCGRLTHLTADIASFEVVEAANARLALVTKTGVRIPLPVSFHDVTLTVRPDGDRGTTYGAAPREVVEDVARRLEEALSEVRSAPTMFRVAPSGPRIAEERVAEEDVEVEEESEPLERRGAS